MMSTINGGGHYQTISTSVSAGTPDAYGKGIGIVSPADTKPVPASKIKLNPAACHNRRRVFMPHIRNYLDRQKASLLLVSPSGENRPSLSHVNTRLAFTSYRRAT